MMRHMLRIPKKNQVSERLYQELGIGVFSMRDDFETIYGDGVHKAD